MSRIQASLLLVLLAGSAALCLALFGPYTGDSSRYLSLAANLAQGNGFSAAPQPPYHPEVFRPPMYPLFLAVLMRLGLGVLGFVAVQLALYLVAIWVSMRTALVITGDRLTAVLLGVLLAVYPPLVRWTTSITAESLCTILFCVCCWCLARHLQHASWPNTMGLGLSVGALFFTRITYVVLVPIVVGVSAVRSRKHGGMRYAVVLAMVVLAPTALWVERNLTVMPSSFNPFGVGSGMGLWVRAVELQEPSMEQRAAWIDGNLDIQVAHGGTEPALQAKADARLFWEGLEVIRSRWRDFVAMTFWLFACREWVEAYDPRLPVAVLWLATGASGTLLAMGYVGIVLMRNRWSLVLPLVGLCFAVAAVHAPFATEGRYTAPVRPTLYMFSAVTAAWGFRKIMRLMGRGERVLGTTPRRES